MRVPVIAVFDIGKTNKKLFLFDESYNIVYERSAHFEETVDDDGDPCENVRSLRDFVISEFKAVSNSPEFLIRAVNFTAYGASLVYIDARGETVGPLYNYLKPYPEKLRKQFYDTYGGEKLFTFQTASPILGSLNSGMQLYRLRHEKPEFFSQIKYALHLPQYISYILTNKPFSEITSVGCHTNLWHFQNMDYHYWVKNEGVLEKFPAIVPSDMMVEASVNGSHYAMGVGLHDSSAALIPYLVHFTEPFVLISTGTWAISLNPFNTRPLTKEELDCDCLSFLQYKGSPVKASRLFAGHHHDQQVQRIAAHFGKPPERYYTMPFRQEHLASLDTDAKVFHEKNTKQIIEAVPFATRDLSAFTSDEHAYHQLVFDLVVQQYASTGLILRGTAVNKIFVDGGFSNNAVYMNLLASFFHGKEVYASSIPQATAIGAALAVHPAWNGKPVSDDIIGLKHYPAPLNLTPATGTVGKI